MGRTILAHSAKNSTWEKHKYSKRVKTPNGWGYVYNNGSHNTVSMKPSLNGVKELFKSKEEKEIERQNRYAASKVADEISTGRRTKEQVAGTSDPDVVFTGPYKDALDSEMRRKQRAHDEWEHWGPYKSSSTGEYTTQLDRDLAYEFDEENRGYPRSVGFYGQNNTNAKTSRAANLEARRNRDKKVTTNPRARGFSSSMDGFTRKPEAARHNTNEENLGVYDYHGGIFDDERDHDPRYYKVYNYGNKEEGVNMQYLLKPNKNNLKDNGYGSSRDEHEGANLEARRDRDKKRNRGHSSSVSHGDTAMNNKIYIAHSAKDTTWKKENPKYVKRVGTPPNAYYIYNNGSHSTGPKPGARNFKTSGSDVGDAWRNAGSTTGSFIAETGQEVVNSVGNAINATGNYIKETVIETKDQAQAYINRKADETKAAYNRHANAAKQRLNQMERSARKTADDAKRQIDSAVNEANNQVNRVKNSAMHTYVNTKANVARTYNNTKERATNAYNRAAGEVQAYGKRAKESAINTRNNLQRSAKAAEQRFEKGVNDTIASARNAYNQGVNSARYNINKAKNYLNTQKARLQNSYNDAIGYAQSEYNRILKEAERKIDAIEARANKIAGASKGLLGDIGNAGKKWKESAFHDGMHNGAYIIHKVPSNPELVLRHSASNTTWEKKNHKYIAKLDGQYFYTPEELRAYTSGAKDKAKGLADKGKEYWDKAKEKGSEYYEKGKEKGSEYYEKGKEKLNDYMNSDERVDRLAKESINNVYQNGRAKLTKKGQREERYVASKMADEVNTRRRPYNENIGDRTRTSSGISNMNKSTSGKSYKKAVDRDKEHKSYNKWRSDVNNIMKGWEKEEKYYNPTKHSVNESLNAVRRKVRPGEKWSSQARNSIHNNMSNLASHHASVKGKYKHVEPNARDRGYSDSRGPKVTSGVSRGYSNGRTGGSKGTDKYLVKDNISRTASKYVNSAKQGASKGAEYAREGYSKAKQGASKGYEYAKRGASKGAEYAREGYSKAKDWYDEQKRKREYRRGFRSGWNSVRGN